MTREVSDGTTTAIDEIDDSLDADVDDATAMISASSLTGLDVENLQRKRTSGREELLANEALLIAKGHGIFRQ